jgi:TRAP transporter TAXI family solute receptor
MIRRLAVLFTVLLTAGCAEAVAPTHGWHDGRLFMATGNTTGVYYQLGGGYADIVTRYLPGYEVRAEPTGASGENIERVASGDMDLGLTLADTASDAARGRGAFEGHPEPIRALARVYRNYTHVIARSGAGVRTVADLRGKRVSTGSPNSGTETIALRLLAAAGLDPDADVQRVRLSLPDTARALAAGTVDAMLWSGGLPTPGITDLLAGAPGQYTFVPVADLLATLNSRYGTAYSAATLPKSAYGTPADVSTIAVANLLVVNEAMPEQLAYDLTRLLFAHQAELAKVHPEGANFDRAGGPRTDPVLLHPGARRYYDSG